MEILTSPRNSTFSFNKNTRSKYPRLCSSPSWRAVGVVQLSSKELYERKPGVRAPLLETPKDMLSKDLEMGVCFYRGPAFGEH